MIALAMCAVVHANAGRSSPDAQRKGADVAKTREYSIKAAYLYNFAKLATWSSSSFANEKQPVTIGVFGKNPFGSALRRLALKKRVHGRRLVIRHLRSLKELSGCHVVFVCKSEEARLSAVLVALQDIRALTVSDIDGFARHGGVIGLRTAANKMTFEVNLDAADRAEIKLSSKLLRLGELVADEFAARVGGEGR